MNLLFKLVSLITMIAGVVLLGFGVLRYRLLYENDRYFDPQTAEVFLIVGIALTIVGLVFAGVSFRARFLRSQ